MIFVVVLMIIILVLVVWAVLIVAVMYRNDLVYRYRRTLIDQIAEVNREEVANGVNDWWWGRYAWFDAVPYEKMLYHWKPFDSFYPDREQVLRPRTGAKKDA